MKVAVSKKELDDYMRYQRLLEVSPCNNCRDSDCCCGCPEQREWNKSIEPLRYAHIDCDTIPIVHDYVKTLFAVEKAEDELRRWINKKNDYLVKLAKISANITKLPNDYGYEFEIDNRQGSD